MVMIGFFHARLLKALTAACVLLAWGSTLRAEDLEQRKAASQEEWRLGLQCATEACACEHFQASLLLYERASNSLKVGVCKRKRGESTGAWRAFVRARELNREDMAAFRTDLEREIEEEQAQMPRLKIEISEPPTDLTVLLDGVRLEAKPGEEVGIPTGQLKLEAFAEGYEPWTRPLVVGTPGVYPVPISLRRVANEELLPVAPLPAVPPPPPVVRDAPPADTTQRIAGVAVGSAGLAAAGLAVFFGVRTLVLLRDSDEFCNGARCTDQRGVDLINDAGRSQTVGIVLGIAGAVAVAGGSALYFTAEPLSTEAAEAPLRVRIGLEGLGVRGGVYW